MKKYKKHDGAVVTAKKIAAIEQLSPEEKRGAWKKKRRK